MATVTPGKDWARTRMLRWAAPAGSVYLLEFDDARRGAAYMSCGRGEWLGRGVRICVSLRPSRSAAAISVLRGRGSIGLPGARTICG